MFFNESIPARETIVKYFKYAKQVNTISNIAYRNSTCENVACNVREMLGKTFDYEVGEVLVCCKYLKLKGGKCSVNFEYVVQTVKATGIVLKDLSGTQVFELVNPFRVPL